MFERVPTNPQITYNYIQNIFITNEIKPYKKEEDIIARRLNFVRWMFQQIHASFVATKTYKSKTEEYLAMIFAEWIKVNVVPGTDLPSGIPDAIAGARRKREEDSDDDSGR
ncbi:10886_t:CDS:2, partial [Racocetra persica]